MTNIKNLLIVYRCYLKAAEKSAEECDNSKERMYHDGAIDAWKEVISDLEKLLEEVSQ